MAVLSDELFLLGKGFREAGGGQRKLAALSLSSPDTERIASSHRKHRKRVRGSGGATGRYASNPLHWSVLPSTSLIRSPHHTAT